MGEVYGKLLGIYISILYVYVYILYILVLLWFIVYEDIYYIYLDRNRYVIFYYLCVYEFLMLIFEYGNYNVNFL